MRRLRTHIFRAIIGIAFVSTASLLSHCTFDQVEAVPLDCDHPYTFESNDSFKVRPIFELTCSYQGCHERNASIGDFTQYRTLKPFIRNGKIFRRVIENKDMPPPYATGPKTLTTEELQAIECWLAAGGPP